MQGGSARFLVTLVIALALAGVGIWMASRKPEPQLPANSPEPRHSTDSQHAEAGQDSAPVPKPDPSSVPRPVPGPSSSVSPKPAPTVSRSTTGELAATRRPPAVTATRKGEASVLHQVTLSGTVTETRQYCGGANPSEEILEALRQPRPLAHHKLYLRRGSTNALANPVLLEISTDADGKFQIALPEGEYCMIEVGKRDALKIPDFREENRKLAQNSPSAMPYKLTSPKCLSDWWQTCDKVLRVEKRSPTAIQIEFHRGCRPPCVEGGPDVL